MKQILRNTEGKKKRRKTKTTTNESKDRKPTPTPLKPGMNSGAPEGQAVPFGRVVDAVLLA